MHQKLPTLKPLAPVHGSKDIKKGTLFSIIKQSGLTLEEFIQLR